MDDGVRRLLREAEVAPARIAPAVRIAVRSVGRVVIVPVHSIIRLEACDNYVRIWADRPCLHKETLTSLVARLDPALFVRVHRSHAVNAAFVRELRSHLHGEYTITLADGAKVESGRSYRAQIRQAFGLD
jgi:two-component system, LytTR family, response regulator